MQKEEEEVSIGWLNGAASLISSPVKYWLHLKESRPSFNDMLSYYLLPWLGVTTFAVFMFLWMNAPDMEYVGALRKSVFVFAYLFFNIYFTSWSFDRLAPVFGLNVEFKNIFVLVASITPVLCVDVILTLLFPGIFFTKIVLLFVLLLTFLGFVNFLNFSKKVALICSLLIFAVIAAQSLVVELMLFTF